MYKIEMTKLNGCYKITPKIMEDNRGYTIKSFNEEQFNKIKINNEFTEDLIVFNKKNVLRGMHFQTKPFEQEKLVCCIKGKILDVVIDMRQDSVTVGMHEVFELNHENGAMIYIPKGCAHGYYCLEESIIGYKLSSRYSQEHDKGILWSECGVKWPLINPILSKKDETHPSLKEYIENRLKE